MFISFAAARTVIGSGSSSSGDGSARWFISSPKCCPTPGLLKQSFKTFPRRRRIRELQAIILDNPSAGNYEELADLYLDEKQFARARECYDKSISSRTDSPDPFYRRGIAECELGDFAAALPDLERVVTKDPQYDFHRAVGLLAHAYAKTGQTEKADALFRQATQISTLSETYLNYASFLASQGRNAEARVGRNEFSPKSPRFRAICDAANVPGFEKQRVAEAAARVVSAEHALLVHPRIRGH